MRSWLSEIPVDVLLQICYALHILEDLFALSTTCKRIRQAVHASSAIWKFHYAKRFGKSSTHLPPQFQSWRSLISLRLALGPPFCQGLLYGLLQFCVEYRDHKTKLDHSLIKMRDCDGLIDLETSDKNLFDQFNLRKKGKLQIKLFSNYDQDQLEPITTFCIEEFRWDEGASISYQWNSTKDVRLTVIPKFSIYGSWPRCSSLQIQMTFESLISPLNSSKNYNALLTQFQHLKSREQKIKTAISATRKFLEVGRDIKYKVLEEFAMKELLDLSEVTPQVYLLLNVVWKIARSTENLLYQQDHARKGNWTEIKWQFLDKDFLWNIGDPSSTIDTIHVRNLIANLQPHDCTQRLLKLSKDEYFLELMKRYPLLRDLYEWFLSVYYMCESLISLGKFYSLSDLHDLGRVAKETTKRMRTLLLLLQLFRSPLCPQSE